MNEEILRAIMKALESVNDETKDPDKKMSVTVIGKSKNPLVSEPKRDMTSENIEEEFLPGVLEEDEVPVEMEDDDEQMAEIKSMGYAPIMEKLMAGLAKKKKVSKMDE